MLSKACYLGIDRLTPRDSTRLKVIIDTLLRMEGESDQRVTIHNLGSRGCMVEAQVLPPIGANLMLMLPSLGWTLAKVRWSARGRFGGRFVDPISMKDFWRSNPPFESRDARISGRRPTHLAISDDCQGTR